MRARLAATATYTAVLLHASDTLVRPAADPIIWEHGRRNMALAEAGLLAVVLPVADGTALSGIGNFGYDLHPVRGFPGASLP
jgi:hypothetical protein